MTNSNQSDESRSQPAWREKLASAWQWIQLVGSVGIVGAALAWLIWGEKPHQAQPTVTKGPPPVRLDDDGAILVERDSTLFKKLKVASVAHEEVNEPLVTTSGSVLASRRPGGESGQDFWQFQSPDALDTYTDWEKAIADLDFAKTQVTQIKELATAKEKPLQAAIERMEKLVKSGTESERTLVAQKAELLQTQIMDRKSVYEAETAVKVAERRLQAITLQLEQHGLSSELLHTSSPELDVVLAEVPEGKLSRIVVGQNCVAHFYGIPDVEFSGKVEAILPVLSTEKRTLRVLLFIQDPNDILRPGMFAEIGIGIDPRSAIRVSADAVVHYGPSDYVIRVVDSDKGPLRLRPEKVSVSELVRGSVEVATGLQNGEQIVTANAILLKPLLMQSIVTPTTQVATEPNVGSDSR